MKKEELKLRQRKKKQKRKKNQRTNKKKAIKKRREEKATKKNKETKKQVPREQQQIKVAEQEKSLEQTSEIASEIFSDTPTIVHISPIGLSTQMHQKKGKIYLFSIISHYFYCTWSFIITTFDFADSRRSDSFKSR